MIPCDSVSSWQTKSGALNKIYEKFLEDDKLKFFEKAIDYIFSSISSTQILIDQILGFIPSECEALKKLASHQKYFGPTITRSINYLLFLLYIREIYLANLQLPEQISIIKVEGWLRQFTNHHDILTEKYAKELILQDNKVMFNSDTYRTYPKIDVAKLIDKFNKPSNILFTKKPQKLKLNNIYNNDDGRCQGIIRYWLRQNAISDSSPKPYKTEIMLNMVRSMNMYNKKLLDKYIDIQINTYQNNSLWQSVPLYHFDEISSVNSEIPQLFIKLIALMQSHKLMDLYAELKTIEHEMGVIFNVKGNRLKVSFLDPNNENLYWKHYLTQDDIKYETFTKYLQQMKYFKKEQKKELGIMVSCYTLDSSVKLIPHNEDNTKFISSISNTSTINQLLLLNVINDNHGLAQFILKNSGCNPNTLYNGVPPLYSAVYNSSIKMVNLLFDNGAVVTPELKEELIKLAYLKNNQEIIKILANI